MAKVKTYNLDGAETGSIKLDDSVFAEIAHSALMYQVVRVAQTNQRQPLAHVKTRSEVRGGGRKPWRQKGTGRARHGSIRSPLWKGGGVTFGPRKENITKLSIPHKMKKKALKSILSDKVRDNKIIIVEDLAKMEKPSTKKMFDFFKKLKMSGKKVLLLSDEGMEHAILSLRNIPRTKSIRLENINVIDLMSYGRVLISKGSVAKLTVQLGAKN
jgi:large subunit ribosomal protein L4